MLLENFGLDDILSYAEKLSEIVGQQFNVIHEQRKALVLLKEKFVQNIRFKMIGTYLSVAKRTEVFSFNSRKPLFH